jgi:Putative ATPase subunit of terminase (gpP-like)
MNRPEPSKWRAAKDRAIDRALAALPEEERKALELDRKEDRQAQRARYAANKEAKEKRNKRFSELYLRGYTKAEIARATGAHEITVSKVLSAFFSHPKPGRDNRIIAMGMSAAELGVLDDLARECLVDRQRVLEMICSAALEGHGLHARKLLRIPSA